MQPKFSNLDYSNGTIVQEVQDLIDQGKDPSEANDWALKNACIQNNLELVTLLLKDKRVDPSADRNMPIKRAIRVRSTLIVMEILRDERTRDVMTDVDDRDKGTFTFKRAVALIKQEKSKKKIGKFVDFLDL